MIIEIILHRTRVTNFSLIGGYDYMLGYMTKGFQFNLYFIFFKVKWKWNQ